MASLLSIVPPASTVVVSAPMPSPTYVPVHRRTPTSSFAQLPRELPIYTIAELMNLRNSPLISEFARENLHESPFISTTVLKLARAPKRPRQQQPSGKKESNPDSKPKAVTKENTPKPSPPRRRVPNGRQASGNTRRKTLLDAASWRPAPRLSTLAQA